MLEGVIDNGTATRADIGRPAAGKTGTNQQYRDAWFVGYTPQVTAGVWIGNADAQVPITIRGTRVTGGSYPATIWHDFMEAAHDGRPELDFVAPDEDRWPRGGSISEEGRNKRPRRPAAPPTSTPESTAEATPDPAVPTPDTAPAPAPRRPRPSPRPRSAATRVSAHKGIPQRSLDDPGAGSLYEWAANSRAAPLAARRCRGCTC